MFVYDQFFLLCESLRRLYCYYMISLLPANLYFLGDIFRPDYIHVLPALIRRFREAKESGAKSVSCLRVGSPWREFLHVDDPGVACVFS